MSYPHMHCARGAVMRQEIGDEQAEPPYLWEIIDANDLIVGAVSQDVVCKNSKSSFPE